MDAKHANIISTFDNERGGYPFTVTMEDGYIHHGIFAEYDGYWYIAIADRNNNPHLERINGNNTDWQYLADHWRAMVALTTYRMDIGLHSYDITVDGE